MQVEKYNAAEHSIITKYKKTLFHKFVGAVKDYQLIQRGDKIAVCISGGKDSMLLAKLMQELSRHGDYPFDMAFIVMDPGYHPQNRQKILDNAAVLEIPVQLFDTTIFDTVVHIDKNPCYLCARMRRGYLYQKAQELGCNKIALGHHFDDVIETILMGMLYGAQVQTMMPRIKSKNFPGMELIRPMYYIRENDILSWSRYHNLSFLQCACRFTEQNAHQDGTGTSKRQEIKHLIQQLKQTNPQVEYNIFRSVERVNLSTIIGYYLEGEEHHFLERFTPSGTAAGDGDFHES